MAQLPLDAVRTLARVAQELEIAQDDWWLVGGAAVALHDLPIDIADVDVLVSARDVDQVTSKLKLARKEGMATDRIHSDIWVNWTALPLGVDFMAGLQVRTNDGWLRIAPITRETVWVGGRPVFVPSRQELIAILRLFGRPKDLARAEGLSSGARSAR